MATLFRITLSLALLLCPLNCLGALTTCDAPREVASCGCCSRCHAEQAPMSPDVPETPDDDCQCGSCLCQGAVVDARLQLPNEQRTVSRLLDDAAVVSRGQWQAILVRQPGERGWGTVAARCARIRLESLLI